jgi:proliferating cell nuclear antigen
MGRLPKFKSEIATRNYPKLDKSTTKISDKNLMELRTGKNHIIRILLECIKYIIHETNIIFYPDSRSGKKDEQRDLITISKQNDLETIAVHIELDGNEFEHYFCDNKYVVGLNIMELFKVIKSVDRDDIIFLYVEKENPQYFCVSTENSKTNEVTRTLIQTIEHEDEGLDIPELEFDISIDIPSQRFQKICKDFSSFKVQNIEIEVIDRQIAISSNGGEVERNVILKTGENSMMDIEYMYRGVFKLAYFNHFTKATPLCDKVTLFLKNDGPLMIEYKIVNVGEMRFILLPFA